MHVTHIQSHPPLPLKSPMQRILFRQDAPSLSGTGIVLWGGGGSVCFLYAVRLQQTLNKNHAGWKGTEGIHPAILMNCAAQAF